MFYTNKIKLDIDNKLKSMQDTKECLLLKIAELTDRNKELDIDINKIKADINNDKVKIDSKLVDFRREVLDEITKQFFDTLDKIFRTSKEISLIATLVNTNGSEIGQLKSQLLKPYIDAKHREERITQGQEIVNKGQKIIEYRNALHEDVIQRQRKGEDITKLKIKLDTYNEILEKLK